MPEHFHEKKVYYHDTDAGGVVYYARYLEHLEEARTEFWRHKGIDIPALAGQGIVFPVVRLEIDYKAPARYGDTLRVYTRPEKVGNASIRFMQEIRRLDQTILVARTVWACVTGDLKVRRIPDEMRAVLAEDLPGEAA